ncbi:hypothetical protein GCM10027422_10040 [Hymenobacter arcticus]
MTRRVSAVHIAQPCPESWAAMTPTGPGRHCAACQKTVVDFTHQTDAEILAALRQAAGETCGRLRADQINRPLIMPTPAPRWRAWLGAALAAGSVLGAGRAAAQANAIYANGGPVPAASAAPNQPSREVTSSTPALLHTDEPVVLRGTVTDANTHEGLPGVTVLVKGTNTGISTNVAGAFELPVAATTQSVTITISMVGYVHQEKTLTLSATSDLQLALLMDTQVLGGLMVIEYERPWPWHPRRFFNWSKYWLAKPFRN